MLEFLSLSNELVLIYGPSGSGKTTLCLQFLAAQKGKIVYIDTENTFRIERLLQINSSFSKDNLILFSAKRYSEQFAAVKSLVTMKHVSLVVIDTFTRFYRMKIQQGISARPLAVRMLTMLKDLHIPVLLTSQVYTDTTGKVHPIAGDLFRRFVVQTWRLDIAQKGKQRSLTIEEQEVNIPFILMEQGLVS